MSTLLIIPLDTSAEVRQSGPLIMIFDTRTGRFVGSGGYISVDTRRLEELLFLTYISLVTSDLIIGVEPIDEEGRSANRIGRSRCHESVRGKAVGAQISAA